jgi:hypothetical protein
MTEFKRTKFPPKMTIYRGTAHLVRKPKPESIIHPLVEYWNGLAYVRSHRIGTKTYLNSRLLIEELLKRGLSKKEIDPEWVTKKRIPKVILTERWTEEQIKSSMDTISAMVSPGYFPGPNSYIRRWDLCTFIYHPIQLTSWFAMARVKGSASLSVEEAARRAAERMGSDAPIVAELLNKTGFNIPWTFIERIWKRYNNMREENPEKFYFYMLGGWETFIRSFFRWLTHKNLPFINLRALSPSGGWLWQQFIDDVCPWAKE